MFILPSHRLWFLLASVPPWVKQPSCPIHQHLPLPTAFFWSPFISRFPPAPRQSPARAWPEEQPDFQEAAEAPAGAAEPSGAAAGGVWAGALSREAPTRVGRRQAARTSTGRARTRRRTPAGPARCLSPCPVHVSPPRPAPASAGLCIYSAVLA